MYKQIVFTGKNGELFRISPRAIGLFILLILYTIPVTLGIPGTGSNIVVFFAEFIIVADWMVHFCMIQRGGYSLLNENANKVKKWTLLFIIYVVISRIILLTTGFDADWFSYPRVSFIFLITFIWITMRKFTDKDKIDAVILFLTYLIVLEMLILQQVGEIRSSKVLLNINIFVCIVIVILPTLTHLALKSSSMIRRLWHFLVLVLSLGLVLFSGSRAGTTIAFVVVLYMFLKEKSIKGKVYFLFIIAATSTVVFFNINNFELQNTLYRAISLITGGRYGFASDAIIGDVVRSNIWYLGFQKFLNRPLLGAGILAFDFNMGIYKVHQSAHNFIIELLMSYGIIGTFIYSILFVNILKMSTGDKVSRRVVKLTTFGYLAFSFVEPTFVEKIILFIFLLLITSNTNKMVKDHYD